MTPDSPHFYYMLGGNLGSLLYGDVSVMKRFYHGVIPSNDANGIANGEDTDQTAPLGAVCSRSVLFAQHVCSKI